MPSAATTRTRKQTISAQSRLKFRPAESKLAQQLRDAATALDQGIASAHSVAATVQEAARSAIPKLQGAVAQQQGLSDQLRAVAPPLDPASGFGKAAAIESQGAAQRLGELKTNAVADYIAQQNRATQGEAFQISNLRNQNAATRERIGQQAVDLKAQEGDYSASLAGKLAERDLQNAFSRAQQQRSFDNSNSQFDKRQAAADRRAAEKSAAAGDKEAAKHAARLRKRESALQKQFVQKVAEVSTWTYEQKNPHDPSTPLVLPVNKAWVSANRVKVESNLKKAGLSPEMARRVVQAYLTVGSGDPGSFKKYATAKTVPGAIQQGGAGLPAHPFG